ncbi:LysR family transcriptional regulator [Paenibacillus sp. BSR1-1]|uniref:LysR family transcriptional regulator n=1 Tax=Paenibacillus sp. BSR1-1 TaxID=3020845 RepID=UPI0025AF4502|nr:LysR family transcriptional regulator [Paenibacillus sp. BSR1-1]MDN3018177.1 LysR family transcriptional regulator [Paenibacillus sp. BSR1-1]
MELLQLKYFQTVARLEHMTRAAEELKIAQPSLSKTISRLEEDLGVPLFDRANRQISLNAFGRLFLERVDRAFLELNEGKREIVELAERSQNQITLAVSIPRVLPDLLSSFLKQSPDVKFQQVLESTSSMKRQLEKAEIDFCISSMPMEGDELVWEPLITEEIYLIVPSHHRLANRERIYLYEVKEEPFISMNTGYGFRNLTDEFCRQAGFVPTIAFEGDEPGVIGDLVRQGLGIAFVPGLSWVNNLNPFSHKLQIIEPNCQRTIGLGWSKRRYHSDAAKQFRQFVIDYFSRISLS